jgi:hypothetical protein
MQPFSRMANGAQKAAEGDRAAMDKWSKVTEYDGPIRLVISM